MFAFDIDLRVKPLFDPSVPHPTPPLRNFAFDTHASLAASRVLRPGGGSN